MAPIIAFFAHAEQEPLLGSRDIVAICEAPDDETATVLSLSVASRGNVRSETLRAFSFDEMKKILGKMV